MVKDAHGLTFQLQLLMETKILVLQEIKLTDDNEVDNSYLYSHFT